MTAKKAPEKPATFEESLGELESIIERIESGEIGLEESLKQYERGVWLVAHCQNVLNTAQQRVEELSKVVPAQPKTDGSRESEEDLDDDSSSGDSPSDLPF